MASWSASGSGLGRLSLSHRPMARGITGHGWIAGSVVLAVCMSPTRAQAYRTFADDDAVAAEATLRVTEFALSPAPDGADWPSAALRSSLQDWQTAGCGVPSLSVVDDDAPAVAGDGVSTVSFVSEGWVALGHRADEGAATDLVLERDAAGHVWIVEADILLNAEHFTFAPEPGPGVLDLQSVLTHELGHALGLLHPCESAAAGEIPACDAVPDLAAATMSPTYFGAEARTLSGDDVAGICFLYPTPQACSPECPVGYMCADGECVPHECPGGGCGDLCTPEACTLSRPCGPETPCEGQTCAIGSPVAGMCVPVRARGAPCVHATDCLSGLCLTSRVDGSYCTVTCVNDAECGTGDYCTEVEGRSVCAPVVASCTAGPGRHGGLPAALAVAAALLGASGTRIRMSRTRKRNQQ